MQENWGYADWVPMQNDWAPMLEDGVPMQKHTDPLMEVVPPPKNAFIHTFRNLQCSNLVKELN